MLSNPPKTILVADDEADMLQLVGSTLRREGFTVVTAATGETALEKVSEEHPDLAILDMMMPSGSGLEVCRAMRARPETAAIPVIMLSACSAEVDRVVAFELGVDDYVTKPFSPRELVLRVKAILRYAGRSEPAEAAEEAWSVGAITLDRSPHHARVEGDEVWLTTIEFNLLRALMQMPGRVQSRHALMQEVWGGESVDPRTIDTQVRRLRAKLGSAAEQIETVRSFGYRIAAR
ncbi:MAG TPA: response regulator transcription factor [Chthoniobacteraceae bacterium]|jgi:two-component system phosphate regulon response regulator PhoB|nr:response regulator transcription factor [Chthoniobacteraceae bacterium]